MLNVRLDARAVVVLLAVLALGGFIWWQRDQVNREREAREKAELEAGIRASQIMSATFGRTADLRVATLSGKVSSRGECKSGNVIPNEQRTVAPYSTEYFVDLRGIDRADYRWNAADRVMFVALPDPTPGSPNVDMSSARSAQSGVFISRACGVAMQRQIAGRMRDAVAEKAKDAGHIAQARDSAKETVTNLIRAPLAAAGLGGVTVRVRFESEAEPRNDEQWDVSRSIEEVFSDPKYR